MNFIPILQNLPFQYCQCPYVLPDRRIWLVKINRDKRNVFQPCAVVEA